MNRFLFVALLFFLVGGGVGLLIGLEIQAPEESVPTSRETVEKPALESEPPVKHDVPAPRPRPVKSKEKLPDLDALVKSVPVPRFTGTGTITGRVQTEEGKPLAGVLIRATVVPLPSSGGRRTDLPPEQKDLEAVLRAAVERFHRQAQSLRQAITGADGRYTLKGIGSSEYRVRAYMKGYDMLPTRIRTWRRVKAGGVVDFRARPAIWVPVSVLKPDGTPASSATVKFQRPNGSATGRPWTPASPEVKVEPGAYTVHAETEDGQASESREVTAEAGVDPPLLVLRLTSRPGVAGRVLFEGEEPNHAFVWILEYPGGEFPDGADLPDKGQSQMVSSIRGFQFSFLGLTPGTYVIGAGRDREFADQVETVVVADRTVEKDLRVPPPDPRNYLQVKVFDPDGKLVEKVYFRIRTEGPRGRIRSGSAEAIPQKKDGSFWIRHPREKKGTSEGERHFVIASAQDYGAQEAEYRPGMDTPVVIRFVAPATLEVTVTGYPGSRCVGKLEVSLLCPSIPGLYYAGGASPDAKGLVELGPVQPGSYDLALFIRTEESGSVIVGRTPLVLQAGKNLKTVPLPALYTVTVQMDHGEGAMVMLRAVDSRNSDLDIQGEVGEKNRVTFDFLPAGDYTLTAMPGGQMRIRVPATGVIRFEPRPVTAMRITVTNPAGALAKGGFQTGDLILGVGKTRFKNMIHMRGLLYEIAFKKSAEFTVLRNGRELVLRFDPRIFRADGTSLGGRMDPASQ